MGVQSFGNPAATFRSRFGRTGKRAANPYIQLSPISATGGNQTPSSGLAPGNGYKYHTFTGPGSLIISSGVGELEYIVVAGGGGGGNGGGGGAGGLLSNSVQMPAPRRQAPFPVNGPATYPVVVGNGGPGGLS